MSDPILKKLQDIAHVTAVLDEHVMWSMLDLHVFDILCLDLTTPGSNGIALCRAVREASKIPILALVIDGDDDSRIAAFDAGADHCLWPSLSPREIAARLNSLVRRAYHTEGPALQREISFAGFRLHPRDRILVDPSGKVVSLTAAEFDLLFALSRQAGKVLSRKQLLSLTFAGSAGPTERSIDVHITRLRRKIEDQPHEPKIIKTIRLGGYMFTPHIQSQ